MKSNSVNMTEGSVLGAMLSYFFPILLGTFFQQLYNTVDSLVVAKYVGKEALSAVGGSTALVVSLLIGFFVGLCSGFGVVIAQYIGAKRNDDVSTCVHTAIAFSVISGAVASIIGYIIAPYILILLKVPEEGNVLYLSTQYLKIYFIGMIGNLVYNMGSAVLRSLGDSKRPFYFLLVSCVANIILDLLFVVVFRWEVIGVAIATILSQLISAVLVFITLLRSKDIAKIDLKKLRINSVQLKRMIRIGLATGLQATMFNIANVIIQSSVNLLGTDAIAGRTGAEKIDAFFWTISASLGITLSNFVGQNFGAYQFERIKKGMSTIFLLCEIDAVILGSIFVIFAPKLIGIFSDDSNVVNYGVTALRIVASTYFIYAPVEVLTNTLNGAGEGYAATLIQSITICGFRLLYVILVLSFINNIVMITIIYPVSWVLSLIGEIWYFKKKSKIYKLIKGDRLLVESVD